MRQIVKKNVVPNKTGFLYFTRVAFWLHKFFWFSVVLIRARSANPQIRKSSKKIHWISIQWKKRKIEWIKIQWIIFFANCEQTPHIIENLSNTFP